MKTRHGDMTLYFKKHPFQNHGESYNYYKPGKQ